MLSKSQLSTRPRSNNSVDPTVDQYIPLTRLISLFTLDASRPKDQQFSDNDCIRLIAQFPSTREMDDVLFTQFNAPEDQPIEGDIYHQNDLRERSIIEEISNSLDACAQTVYVTIEEDYYSIQEVDGMGMSPSTLCQKYLLPKATTKTLSDHPDQIGRFGIGSCTKLAHLQNQNDIVIVETRAENYPGIRVCFKLINEIISVHMQIDGTITSYGTATFVFSDDIDRETYTSVLKEFIVDTGRTQLWLNDELFVPTLPDHSATISIGGIKIQQVIQDAEQDTTRVHWVFPRVTTIPESRNKIILDSNESRKLVMHYISTIFEKPNDEWHCYANTIATLVQQLQLTNNSYLSTDNVLDFLRQIVQKKMGPTRCVPDIPLYSKLLSDKVVALHPAILPEGWLARITLATGEWNKRGTTVYTATLSLTDADDVPFIHDSEENHVIVDEEFYNSLKNEEKLWLLELIFKDPPGEINATLAPQKSVADQEKTAAQIETNSENVSTPTLSESAKDPLEIFPRGDQPVQDLYQIPALTSHRYHAWYQKHGVLWSYSEESLTAVLEANPKAASVLVKAPTLMVRKPNSYYRWLKKNENYEHFSPFRFNGKNFYIARNSITGPVILLDTHFQFVRRSVNPLLYAKVLQWKHILSNASVRNCEQITLTQHDQLVLRNRGNNKNYLVDGTGKNIRIHPDDIDSVQVIGDGYYHYIFITMYEREHRIGYRGTLLDITFSDFSDDRDNLVELRWELSKQHRHIALGFGGVKSDKLLAVINLQLKDSPVRKAGLYNNLLLSVDGEYVLHNHSNNLQHKINTARTIGDMLVPVRYEYNIYSIEGDLLTSFSSTQELFTAFVCERVNNKYYISLKTEHGSEFVICEPNKEALYLRDDDRLGFPITATVQRQNGKVVITPINQETFPTLAGVELHRINDVFVLLTQQDGALLINGNTLHTWKYFIENYKSSYDKVIMTKRGPYLFNGVNLYSPESKKINQMVVTNVSLLEAGEDQLFLLEIEAGDNGGFFDVVVDLDFSECATLRKLDLTTSTVQKHTVGRTFGIASVYSCCFTQYGSLRGNSLGFIENQKIPAERLFRVGQQYFTYSGYPLISQPSFTNLKIRGAAVYESEDDHSLLVPLTLEQLKNPHILDVLEWLNEQWLDEEQYSRALCFVHFSTETLYQMLPWLDVLTHVAGAEWQQDYLDIIAMTQSMSKADQRTILSLFNFIYHIRHGQQAERVTPKLQFALTLFGIDVLSTVYTILGKIELSLIALDFDDIISWSKIIDKLPALPAQLIYYFLFNEHQLMKENIKPCFAQLSESNELSLIDLMIAYQRDQAIFIELQNNELSFVNRVTKLSRGANKEHFIRTLQHAIYHQANPNDHLYQREFLQNAMDAYVHVPLGEQPKIEVTLFREENHCVFRLEESGSGMNEADILGFFALPYRTSKRSDDHEHYIGGHGVGVFTAYHDAELIRLLSGTGKGSHHCFEFRPIYENNRVVDIRIRWETRAGKFQGSTVERVSRGKMPTFDAASYHRNFKRHGRCVDRNKVYISLNDIPVNQSTPLLAAISIPNFGRLRLVRSPENMITIGGLTLRTIDDLDQFIPKEIRRIVRKHGIIIDLPQKLPQNRERTELIDSRRVYTQLQPYILHAYILAYIKLFLDNHLNLSELPYDFIDKYERYIDDMYVQNPHLLDDVKCIMNNTPLSNYATYQNPAKLHALLAHLPLFVSQNKVMKFSMIDLVQYFITHQSLPPDVEVPAQINRLLGRYRTKQLSIRIQEQQAASLVSGQDNLPQRDWVPSQFDDLPGWLFITRLVQHIAAMMYEKPIKIGFSTKCMGQMLHVVKSSPDVIFMSVLEEALINKFSTLLSALAKGKLAHEAIWKDLFDSIAHELTHIACESNCNSTHNRTFFLNKRTFLIRFARNFHTDIFDIKVAEMLSECFADDVDHVLDVQKLIKQTWAYLSPVSATLSSRFHHPHSQQHSECDKKDNNYQFKYP